MQVKSIAECSNGSILQSFWPSLCYHLSVRYFLSIFEWSLKTVFTVEPKNWEKKISAHPYPTACILHCSSCWLWIWVHSSKRENEPRHGIFNNQQRLRLACAYEQSDQGLCWSLKCYLTVKLLTEHHLEFLSLKGGCKGWSESTLVKMPQCWKSHVTTQIILRGWAHQIHCGFNDEVQTLIRVHYRYFLWYHRQKCEYICIYHWLLYITIISMSAGSWQFAIVGYRGQSPKGRCSMVKWRLCF